MKRSETIIANAIFALHVLLVFLLIFSSQVRLPGLLQVGGRLHPLLLHLPIGMLVVLALLPLLRGQIDPAGYRRTRSFLLQVTALAAVLTALSGFFLSREGGYDPADFRAHLWTGAGVAWASYALLLIDRYSGRPVLYAGAFAGCLLLLVVAGHLGAELTHGRDYLLAPLRPATAPISLEDTPLYTAAVQPILEQRCTSCHNERKAKGKLIMTTAEGLARGGENGPLWIAGDPGGSAIMQRLRLPVDHDEHMPPVGKPQPSEAEIALLHAWIEAGADTTRLLADYPDDHPLQRLAPAITGAVGGNRPAYTFAPADPATLRRLNTPFRTVTPLTTESPALRAEIFVREAYEPRLLTELEAVAPQLVALDLSNLPVSDDDLRVIGGFEKLEKLILNGTDITTNGLAELRGCRTLRSLALSSTSVDAGVTPLLQQLPNLRELFIWNTGLTAEAVGELQQAFPTLAFHTGYRPDEKERLPVPAPILDEKKKDQIALRHPLPGAVVRYTTDGTDPDSARSPLYREPLPLKQYTVLRTQAFCAGWEKSPVREFHLFPQGLTPQKVTLLHPPDDRYRGRGVPALTDGEKGDANNFSAPFWLGFRQQPLIANIAFGAQPPKVRRVTLSYAVNMGSYLMPPAEVEVWGGRDSSDLRLLRRLSPPLPDGYRPNQVRGLEIDIPPAAYPCLKVVARPVAKLPDWHQGRGDKGWLFVDEVFFYP